MKVSAGIVVLALSQALAGCGASGSSSVPTAPSPAIQIAVFTDRVSGFSTSDVRDAHQRILRFSTSHELIWPPTGGRFSGYSVYGNRIQAYIACPPSWSCQKRSWSGEVRFGTKNGERRAYLTCNCEDGSWIVDIEVVDGQVVISETGLPVPET